jgi:hypothetical protein
MDGSGAIALQNLILIILVGTCTGKVWLPVTRYPAHKGLLCVRRLKQGYIRSDHWCLLFILWYLYLDALTGWSTTLACLSNFYNDRALSSKTSQYTLYGEAYLYNNMRAINLPVHDPENRFVKPRYFTCFLAMIDATIDFWLQWF